MNAITRTILLFILVFLPLTTYGQGQIRRPKMPKTETNGNNSQSKVKKYQISQPDGIINGFGYVDLGLTSKTKWAACNLGSKEPTKIGNFYSWGEILPKSIYNKDSYFSTISKLGDISGNERYDAATYSMGHKWCMPTIKQWKELQKECKFTTISYEGVRGVLVEGPNGHNIFFPVSGEMNDHGHVEGSSGARHNLPFNRDDMYSVCKFWASSDNNSDNTYHITFDTYFEHPNMIDSFLVNGWGIKLDLSFVIQLITILFLMV